MAEADTSPPTPGVSSASKVSPAPAAGPHKRYTAVVYVHGMGEQRRFEEMSRLIDGLDSHAFQLSQEHPIQNRKGRDPRWLVDIKPALEPCRVSGKDDVGFVRLDCQPSGTVHGVGSLYRFYEVYWAPLVAGGSPLTSIIPWLVRQVMTPLRIVGSPWRERQRLRRAALHGLWRRGWLHAICRPNDGDLTKLIDAYNDFEGLEARREHAKGTFRQFRRFLGKQFEPRPDTAVRLDRMARLWRLYAVGAEFAHLFVLVTLIGTLAMLLGLAGYAIWLGLGWLWSRGLAAGMPLASWAGLRATFEQTPANALAMLSLMLSALGLTRFVKVYLGDVQFWCTYEETDEKHAKRAAILGEATLVLEHVLADEYCARVVVVAHSLGTAIAMDALLQLGRHNRARTTNNPISGPLPLERIVVFVTMGSPVDKIHYFFESYRSAYHRYIRVVEGIRGDITEIPFAKNRKPHIHWINFWDRADLVSGALETPAGPRLANLRVDNVQVSSYAFPDPGASHSGYFQHRQVLAHLYDIIFKGTADFEFAPKTAADRPDYDAVFLSSGTGHTATIVFQAMALVLPWILVMSLISGVTWGLWLGVTIFAGLAVGMLTRKAFGHRVPLRATSGRSPEGLPSGASPS
jgi:hypothetical protein